MERATRIAPSAEERALFLKRFTHFGAHASAESYLALFHPEARLFDDAMERPIGTSEIGAHIEGVLALVRGFRMTPERWRARDDVIFVEAHNAGEIAGAPVAWRAAYRIELEGSLVRDGRRYFDRTPLLAKLAPDGPALPAFTPQAGAAARDAVAGVDTTPDALVGLCAEAWRAGTPEAIASLYREDATLTTPGAPRPLAGDEVAPWMRHLRTVLGGARLGVRRWAGDDALLFVEWEAEVATPRGPHAFGLVDRFDLLGGRVLAARCYFDANALARALGRA